MGAGSVPASVSVCGSVSVSVPSTGAEMVSVRGDCCAAAALDGEGDGGFAYSPVLWIMEPSLRERMKVD